MVLGTFGLSHEARPLQIPYRGSFHLHKSPVGKSLPQFVLRKMRRENCATDQEGILCASHLVRSARGNMNAGA